MAFFYYASAGVIRAAQTKVKHPNAMNRVIVRSIGCGDYLYEEGVRCVESFSSLSCS